MAIGTIITLLFLLIALLMILYCFFPGFTSNSFALVVNVGRIIGLVIGLIVLYIVYLIVESIVTGAALAIHP